MPAMRTALLAVVACMTSTALGACASRPAPPARNEIEAFMWAYTEAWNRHDSAVIARDFYRMGGRSVAEETAARETAFADLRAQGYHHSDIHEVKGCLLGSDRAWAGMKFSRLKADGEPLPPKDRASSYELAKFADGWRVTRLMGADAAKPLECPAPGAG